MRTGWLEIHAETQCQRKQAYCQTLTATVHRVVLCCTPPTANLRSQQFAMLVCAIFLVASWGQHVLAPARNATLSFSNNRGFLNWSRRRRLAFANTSTGRNAEENESYGR